MIGRKRQHLLVVEEINKSVLKDLLKIYLHWLFLLLNTNIKNKEENKSIKLRHWILQKKELHQVIGCKNQSGVENLVNKGKYLVPRKRRIHTNLATCFAITALVKSLGHTFSVAFALSHRGGGWGRSSTNPLSSINFPCVWSRGLPDPWVRASCGCSRFHF